MLIPKQTAKQTNLNGYKRISNGYDLRVAVSDSKLSTSVLVAIRE